MHQSSETEVKFCITHSQVESVWYWAELGGGMGAVAEVEQRLGRVACYARGAVGRARRARRPPIAMQRRRWVTVKGSEEVVS